MVWVKIFAYVFIIVFCGAFVHMMANILAHFARRRVPFVPSFSGLRRLVVKEINSSYKNAKYICDFGAGYGGLSRLIARNTCARVVALENMPYNAMVSKILDLFCFRPVKTVWCDGFKYLDNMSGKFDVLVAYMGPDCTTRLKEYKDKTDVVISIDFQISGMTPIRKIPLGHHNTIYDGKKYPHCVYVYEFNNS